MALALCVGNAFQVLLQQHVTRQLPRVYSKNGLYTVDACAKVTGTNSQKSSSGSANDRWRRGSLPRVTAGIALFSRQ